MGKSLTRWLAERELKSLSRRVPERATQIDRSSVPVTVEVDDTPVEFDYPVPDLLGEGVRAGQQADMAREESEFAKSLAEQLETELGEAQGDLDQALADATTALSEAGLARSEAAEAVSDAADAVAQATQAIQDALAASVKADGVNTFSDRVPVAADADGKPVGAAWFVRDSAGISQVWELTSLGWVERPLEEAIIPKVAIGEGTYGDLSGGRIVAGSIVTEKLDALAVTAAKLAAEAVTAVKIAADAVTTEKIAAGAVTANEIAALAITAEKLAAASITAEKIAAGAITTGKLAADAIDGMTITGALVRTAETGARLELDTTGLKSINNSNQVVATIGTDSEGVGVTGAGGRLQLKASRYTLGLQFARESATQDWDKTGGGFTSNTGWESYTDEDNVHHSDVEMRNTSLVIAGKPLHENDSAAPQFEAWVRRREDGSTAGGMQIIRVNKFLIEGTGAPTPEMVFRTRVSNPGNAFPFIADLEAWDSAPDGTRAWVTADNREYVRVNGQWKPWYDGSHDTDWVRLDGWSAGFTHSPNPVNYRVQAGYLELRGSLINNNHTALSVVGQLPLRYTPEADEPRQLPMNSSVNRFAQFRPNGDIRLYGSDTSTAYWNFGGIRLPLD